MARRRTLAQRADKYVYYQRSVQEPEVDVAFLDRTFKKTRGRPARSMREDFAGTSAFSCAWVARHRENTAFAIDLDPEPLDWGRGNNVAALTPDQQSRVKLIEGDVRTVGHEPVDVTVAYNFSYFLFDTRPELVRYFEAARATLKSDGLLFLDVYGGGQAMEALVEETEFDDFIYVWEQKSFDPISHRGENRIHFKFPDGSEMRRAFSYDWRIWTIPELRELLAEAGFSDAHVYWEGTDRKTGEGNDVFSRRERAEGDPAWVAHIIAVK
ncbi:MAG: class I SAM-dependent methyltransferase [Myxococcota bacterium]